MTDRERRGPYLAVVPRYSSTIPPERRGRTSGKFRFDLTEKLHRNVTYEGFVRLNYSRESLMQWTTSAVLLKSFETWDLLPPEIRERDGEEQKILMRFIADGVPDPEKPGKRKLPSVEAIMVELARVLLGSIEEWNILEPSIQMMLEHEMIEFIGQHHEEMDIRNEEVKLKPEAKFIRELESNHIVDHKPANHSQVVEKARQEVVAKITKKITTLVGELDYEGEEPRGNFYDLDATTLVDIEELERTIRAATQGALTEPLTAPETPAEKRDTIPASPIAKARSEKPQRK